MDNLRPYMLRRNKLVTSDLRMSLQPAYLLTYLIRYNAQHFVYQCVTTNSHDFPPFLTFTAIAYLDR